MPSYTWNRVNNAEVFLYGDLRGTIEVGDTILLGAWRPISLNSWYGRLELITIGNSYLRLTPEYAFEYLAEIFQENFLPAEDKPLRFKNTNLNNREFFCSAVGKGIATVYDGSLSDPTGPRAHYEVITSPATVEYFAEQAYTVDQMSFKDNRTYLVVRGPAVKVTFGTWRFLNGRHTRVPELVTSGPVPVVKNYTPQPSTLFKAEAKLEALYLSNTDPGADIATAFIRIYDKNGLEISSGYANPDGTFSPMYEATTINLDLMGVKVPYNDTEIYPDHYGKFIWEGIYAGGPEVTGPCLQVLDWYHQQISDEFSDLFFTRPPEIGPAVRGTLLVPGVGDVGLPTKFSYVETGMRSGVYPMYYDIPQDLGLPLGFRKWMIQVSTDVIRSVVPEWYHPENTGFWVKDCMYERCYDLDPRHAASRGATPKPVNFTFIDSNEPSLGYMKKPGTLETYCPIGFPSNISLTVSKLASPIYTPDILEFDVYDLAGQTIGYAFFDSTGVPDGEEMQISIDIIYKPFKYEGKNYNYGIGAVAFPQGTKISSLRGEVLGAPNDINPLVVGKIVVDGPIGTVTITMDRPEGSLLGKDIVVHDCKDIQLTQDLLIETSKEAV